MSEIRQAEDRSAALNAIVGAMSGPLGPRDAAAGLRPVLEESLLGTDPRISRDALALITDCASDMPTELLGALRILLSNTPEAERRPIEVLILQIESRS